MLNYKLLTPGPLTTSSTVKEEMLFDHCTWDEDYKQITRKIIRNLLRLAHAPEETYTAVLMQGSGTFGVESVIVSSVRPQDKILVCANGAYGQRMAQIAQKAGLQTVVYQEPYDQIPRAEKVTEILSEDPSITHVGIIHSETTSGILNDIEGVGKAAKEAGKTLIVDAMSSFGGTDIDVPGIGIDFIISSANKCIQGVPGFSFIICRKKALSACEGISPSLSLDLYDQWATMNQDGKWRFTSPTHVVLAFAKAMEELGFRPYIDTRYQGPIITTFYYPEHKNFSFDEMYRYIKERGYAIYPGKVTDADTFRIGNIGEIYPEDIIRVCDIMKDFLKEKEILK